MQIQLIYDGKALENNEINPRDLASAVLSIEALLYEANSIINEDKAEIKTRVKASFETGSFKINFEVTKDLLNSVMNLFNSSPVTAIVNAAGLLAVLVSFVKLLKFLKGKKPEKIYENQDSSFTVKIDKKSEIYEKKVIILYKNYKIKKAFEQLVSPLKKKWYRRCWNKN